MTIKEYIIENYLHSESTYVKLMKFSGTGLIIQKWLDDHQEIKSFIENWLSDLIPFEHPEYTNTVFYMKPTGECVLEDNSKIYYLCVRYSDFWEILENKYHIKYADIQLVIKYMVEEAFKLKVKTPDGAAKPWPFRVEEAFKLKVKTPGSSHNLVYGLVEEAFKLKVKTPSYTRGNCYGQVEEAFKLKNNVQNLQIC